MGVRVAVKVRNTMNTTTDGSKGEGEDRCKILA